VRGWLLAWGLLVLTTPALAALDPNEFAYHARPGARLPLQTEFRNAHGDSVRLGALLRGVPLVLALGYFHCPSLCGVVRDDMLRALNGASLVAGRDYALVALSIDPAETSADAAAARTADLAADGAPGAAEGWHYLTGSAAAVQEVAAAVGFRDKLNAATKQFIHPAGVVVATPDGVVSSYLLGVGYTPTDMRAAVARADAGRIAAAASPILLICFHFDPQTGRYTLAVYRLLRLAAAVTVITLGGTLLLTFRRHGRA
jgi:protein SCO1/2